MGGASGDCLNRFVRNGFTSMASRWRRDVRNAPSHSPGQPSAVENSYARWFIASWRMLEIEVRHLQTVARPREKH